MKPGSMLFKHRVFALFPRLMVRRERYLNYVKIYIPVISDLSIHLTSEIDYDPKSYYACMFHGLPKHYARQLAARNFDDQGVPRFLYQGKLYYHPTGIAQYGLSEYGYWLSTKDQTHLDHAMTTVDWLINQQVQDTGVWHFCFPYPHNRSGHQFQPPWSSAMAQGLGISLLTRIYLQTGKQVYLDAALKATTLLPVPVGQGGFCDDLFGHPVYEEYPTTPASFTLNGFCFCLFGLYDLAQLSDEPGIQKLWEDGRKTLSFMVSLYDNDFISSYDLTHVFGKTNEKNQSLSYHILHIGLLQNMYAIDPKDVYLHYIKKWSEACGVTP